MQIESGRSIPSRQLVKSVDQLVGTASKISSCVVLSQSNPGKCGKAGEPTFSHRIGTGIHIPLGQKITSNWNRHSQRVQFHLHSTDTVCIQRCLFSPPKNQNPFWRRFPICSSIACQPSPPVSSLWILQIQ